MSNKQKLEIELRGDRLFAISSHLGHKTELDITSVWHFCKEAFEYLKEPRELEIEKVIGEHNAKILNEYQLQGMGDEQKLFPVLEKATEETLKKEEKYYLNNSTVPCEHTCKWECWTSLPTVHDCDCH